MLEYLIDTYNMIDVYERVLDRDGTETARLHIGSGYGIFRGQSVEEFAMLGSANFTSIGILIHYSEDHSTEEAGTKTHFTPGIGDICIWHGQEYYISGVSSRPDIHGELVGYTIRCSNG